MQRPAGITEDDILDYKVWLKPKDECSGAGAGAERDWQELTV